MKIARRALFLALAAASIVVSPSRSADAPAASAANPTLGTRDAVDPSRASGKLFERLDSNRDGFLSRPELEADPAARGNWIAMDRDDDGRISREEFAVVERRDERAANESARRP